MCRTNKKTPKDIAVAIAAAGTRAAQSTMPNRRKLNISAQYSRMGFSSQV